MKPKAYFARYITMVPHTVNDTDSMHSFFFPEVFLPSQLTQTKKMSTHYNWNCFAARTYKAMKPKANFAHYITMVPLTDSMQRFSHKCPSPHTA